MQKIILLFLDPNKASGINDIPPRILWLFTDDLHRPFFNLFTIISQRYGIISTGWKVPNDVPMYLFKFQDIIFAVKSLEYSTKGFNILHHISFSTSNMCLSSNHNLSHTNNYNRHSFIHSMIVSSFECHPCYWFTSIYLHHQKSNLKNIFLELFCINVVPLPWHNLPWRKSSPLPL